MFIFFLIEINCKYLRDKDMKKFFSCLYPEYLKVPVEKNAVL